MISIAQLLLGNTEDQTELAERVIQSFRDTGLLIVEDPRYSESLNA
jgi:hypothetical protein